MESKTINLEVNTTKTFLASEAKIYKTEEFFFATKKLVDINFFILKLGETIMANFEKLRGAYGELGVGKTLQIKTLDGEFCFYLIFGQSVPGDDRFSPKDVIFFSAGEFENLKQNDQRVSFFLKRSKIFSVQVNALQNVISENHLKKMYLVSSMDLVNFPLLSDEQYKLVEIEKQNVLVQGVAGSGKTNICYSKIIWTACRNYSGKILYTTFSRGLLVDTKNKIELYKNSIKKLIDDYQAGRIVFLDKNHKAAVENRLGTYIVSDTERNIISKLNSVVSFLENNVDYKLIEDIYFDIFGSGEEIAGEDVFARGFLNKLGNHQLSQKLQRIKNISPSVIYKEIYGMIFGRAEVGQEMLSLSEYKTRRKDSFNDTECEVIYELAVAYNKFKKAQNYIDNNEISRKLIENIKKIKKYSLIIADEVQDFTRINLQFFAQAALKLFCVGDALQMINPAYFSFAELKKLMYNEDVTDVIELESNYRNNHKIAEILSELSKINIRQFGTHSFVVFGKSVDEAGSATTVYTEDAEFLNQIQKQKFEDFTFLVADQVQKQELRKKFPKQEILTISEVKGLERESVVLVNLLSSNLDKWNLLDRIRVNHKTADENSVLRYYFNLFYVGLSRAKHNVFVLETKEVGAFKEFFASNFDKLDASGAFGVFSNVISKDEIDEDEIYVRIDEFIRLGQFDNAMFYAKKLGGYEEFQQTEKIDAYKKFVFKGKNKEAGIKLWKAGLTAEAKHQFEIAGEQKLIDFLESIETNNQTSLDGEIVRFWNDFEDNEDARGLIIDTLFGELEDMRRIHEDSREKLKMIKGEKYGK